MLVVKRLLDIVLSSIVLAALLPVFVIVGIVIRLDSPGPVFYRGIRIGRYGRPFRMYKFRTMVISADKDGPSSTPVDDRRITRVGKYLRKFNVDELPQFINVLRGEMSIVGPRPQVPWAVARYTDEEQTILTMRPGITDWATIWIRDEGEILRGSNDPDLHYLEKIWPEKRRLQLEYVRNHSVWIDIKIMVMTLRTHLLHRVLPRSGQRRGV